MKCKFYNLCLFFVMFSSLLLHAQERTITGVVSDDSGPLPGVSVIIKGTATGSETDFDGKYSINAKVGDVLQFSFVGMTTQEAIVGTTSIINVTLKTDNVLEEVVVTAQGIKREKRSLGYSVSKIKSDEIEERSDGDIGRVLRGKAAGINITSTNGVSGSGTNIIIRGFTSLTGSNQPLFVVNGVPFDGGSNSQNTFFDNQTESSRFLDLDPNSIESVNVLKGLSASVLYGERGRNGVILITTKAGSSKVSNKKLEVTFSQSYFVSEAILPKYQNEYGGGFHQNFGFFFSNHGASFDPNSLSNQVLEATNSLFIGRAPDGTALLMNPLTRLNDQTLVAGFEDIANAPYEYKPYDSVDQFFRTGGVSTTSVNIRGGNEKASFNMNYGHLDDKGFTPGNSLRRNTFGIGGNTILSNKMTINGALNFTRSDYKTPPVAASAGSGVISSGSSVFGDVLYTPRSVDLFGLPFQASDGRSVYYRSGNDIQNPRWTIANSKVTQKTDRVFGNMSLNYGLNDWLNVAYRLGLDTYTEFNTLGQNKGGVDGDVTGIYRTITARNTIWDHNLTFSGDKNITEDLNLKVILGGSLRRDEYFQDGVESTGQLSFGVLEHFNFVNHSTVGSFFSGGNLGVKSEVNTMGVYADVTLGYKNYLYLNGAVRNDWSSTLEKDNQSIFYPGTSLSFIPTSAFENLVSEKGLNYLKLRLGYGTSAGFPLPYGTRNTLALTSRLFVDNQGNVLSGNGTFNGISSRLGNPNLKPETVSEFELGLDSKFFNNRLGLNLSVYKRKSKDLITDQGLDPSSGFTVTRINAGELEAEGIEIDLDVAVLKNIDGLNWNISGNFFADETTVTKLPEGVNKIALTGTIGGRAANFAVEGEPYGILLGNAVLRTNGQRTVNSSGDYIVNTGLNDIVGDPNPDFTASINNLITYKGFSFNMNWQYRQGGDVYSVTAATLVGRGIVDADRPLDRERTYVLPGVQQDGSVNTVQLTTTRIYFNNLGFGADEFFVNDGTTLRLNEASIGYKFPKKLLEKSPFGSLSITISGSNLWYKAFNFPDDVRFDTNNLSTGVGNGQGIDFISGPSSRRYGLSLKATF